eukprot:6659-Heterococcus_DN1.PRE.1
MGVIRFVNPSSQNNSNNKEQHQHSNKASAPTRAQPLVYDTKYTLCVYMCMISAIARGAATQALQYGAALNTAEVIVALCGYC